MCCLSCPVSSNHPHSTTTFLGNSVSLTGHLLWEASHPGAGPPTTNPKGPQVAPLSLTGRLCVTHACLQMLRQAELIHHSQANLTTLFVLQDCAWCPYLLVSLSLAPPFPSVFRFSQPSARSMTFQCLCSKFYFASISWNQFWLFATTEPCVTHHPTGAR